MSAHNEEHAPLIPVEDWAPEPVVVPMKAPDEPKAWLAKPGKIRLVCILLFATCGVSVLLDLFYDKHVHEGAVGRAEGWFGFFGFYGFLSCVALVLAAKVLRLFVMRGENYYDE